MEPKVAFKPQLMPSFFQFNRAQDAVRRDARDDLDLGGPVGHGDRVRRLLPAAALAALSRPPAPTPDDGTSAADADAASHAASPLPPPKHDAVQQPRTRFPVGDAPAFATPASAAASAEPRFWAIHGAPSAGKQAFISLTTDLLQR